MEILDQGFKDDEWMTTEEAAAFLKIGIPSLRNMTSNGKVPYYKLGRRNRYRKLELVEMLMAEKRGPGALEEREAREFAAKYPALNRRRNY